MKYHESFSVYERLLKHVISLINPRVEEPTRSCLVRTAELSQSGARLVAQLIEMTCSHHGVAAEEQFAQLYPALSDWDTHAQSLNDMPFPRALVGSRVIERQQAELRELVAETMSVEVLHRDLGVVQDGRLVAAHSLAHLFAEWAEDTAEAIRSGVAVLTHLTGGTFAEQMQLKLLAQHIVIGSAVMHGVLREPVVNEAALQGGYRTWNRGLADLGDALLGTPPHALIDPLLKVKLFLDQCARMAEAHAILLAEVVARGEQQPTPALKRLIPLLWSLMRLTTASTLNSVGCFQQEGGRVILNLASFSDEARLWTADMTDVLRSVPSEFLGQEGLGA